MRNLSVCSLRLELIPHDYFLFFESRLHCCFAVTIVTGAPVHVFGPDLLSTGLAVRHAILDTGAKQRDAFTVDQRGSLEEYVATASGPRRDQIIIEESTWLRECGADIVISDIVPLACVSAATAGVPCIAVSNFSWDFIYSEYLTAAGSAFKDLVWQIADDYACALCLLRLPGHVPMPAFREVVDVPLVVRHAKRSRHEVRSSMGLPLDAKIACFIYGGQPPGADWKLKESCLPAGWLCLVCSAGKPPGGDPLPPNFILVPGDSYTPDLIEASDVVLGKIGYGTTSECLAHHRPLVFLRRDYFNEEPFLRKLLEVHESAVEMKRRDFLAGNWAPYLQAAVTLKPNYNYPTNGADVVAEEVIQTARAFRQNNKNIVGSNNGAGAGGGFISSPLSSPLSPTAPGAISNGFNSYLSVPVGRTLSGGVGGLTSPLAAAAAVPAITNTSTFQHPGQSRLRDTIAWGYMMARPRSGGAADVPEWYTRGQLPFSCSASAQNNNTTNNNKPGSSCNNFPPSKTNPASTTVPPPTSGISLPDVESLFHIQKQFPQISLDQFPDTLRFLSLLGSLEDHAAIENTPTTTFATSTSTGIIESTNASTKSTKSTVEDTLVLPELRAAAGLFLREETLLISRAPGRLDVMGGIADYSGSTVLQMPIAEAAHVALQLQSPRKQRLWRHMHHRHSQAGDTIPGAPISHAGKGNESDDKSLHPPVPPALRIVSLNADATNRGPAFDMDLQELIVTTENGEEIPISYSTAREYFKKDPALTWAAYIAGAIVVLMHEKGMKLSGEGIAMLVSSEVPEGKGVSSSAAVEVAAMNALASAHNIHLTGRELALLCQKVENLIVGAPCGVMDQMASSLGEAGWLLALRCQPAEVEKPVHIPSHLKFWGIDSGIRHSVGGSDYGAVRVGAFMGLKILKNALERTSTPSIEYLARIPPSAFKYRLERKLPETLTGKEFLNTYGDHIDTVTKINEDQTYAVRIPTGHPLYENFRVLSFRQALAAEGTSIRQQMEVLGELMLQSHISYTACGLGSEGTDRLVALVMEEKLAAEAEGREPSVFGGKITGGGCGGTVCVLSTADEAGEQSVKRITARYEAETGHAPYIFEGASQGAAQFGVVEVKRRHVQ
jgi:L-arabinokinase